MVGVLDDYENGPFTDSFQSSVPWPWAVMVNSNANKTEPVNLFIQLLWPKVEPFSEVVCGDGVSLAAGHLPVGHHDFRNVAAEVAVAPAASPSQSLDKVVANKRNFTACLGMA
jgi:hypothetical protein